MPIKEASVIDINFLNLLNMTLKKTAIYLSAVIILLLTNIVQVQAQGVPCGDPDIDCPIDTPVILLVAAALFLTVKKLPILKLN